MDSVITYWNRAATELYGWPAQYALGKASHQPTRTKFPEALETIMTELMRTGRWEGDLVHTTRDGAEVTVSSRWSLQRGRRHRAARGARFRARNRSKARGPAVRGILHHQARRNGNGPVDQPLDHRSSRRPDIGRLRCGGPGATVGRVLSRQESRGSGNIATAGPVADL